MLNKIKASGKVENIDFTFEAYFQNKKLIVIDDTEDENINKFLKEKIEYLLNTERIVIGGTYYPKKDTLLAVYIVLKNYFFDDKDYKLEVIGELEQIPYEEGVIY